MQRVSSRLSECDIVVVGSGFGGSLLAMIARRLGHSVTLVERGKHPRVVIGESSTPLSNLLLDELATRYDLPALKSFAKWGTWQQEHPEIACGLKRGFTFFHHDLNRPRVGFPERMEQLLVAASPHDGIADTHWYRADFDQHFVREAQRLGVLYLDETTITEVAPSIEGLTLEGTRRGVNISLSARFVVDASGPRGFLHHALNLGEKDLPGLPPTQSLYGHFSGVKCLEDREPSNGQRPPYPIDAAAVHHVFDGGWIWVLQFNNGITSAGIAATDALADRMQLADGSEAWSRILQCIPVLRKQFENAQVQFPFTYLRRTSFRSASVAGANWALLPSAAGFVDPLLSTGFALTLLGITRLAEIIEQGWGSPHFSSRLQQYADNTDAELVATGRLIGTLYASMNNFQMFVSLSLLYFAAASFSETARRLHKSHLAPSFLLHDHPLFGPECLRLFEHAHQVRTKQESTQLTLDVLSAIEPFNIAGLGNLACRNWYPVDPLDLLNAAWKVEASRADILGLMERCGFSL